MTDTEIQDFVPHWCREFEFSANGSFYPAWEPDFSAVDIHTLSPFAADSHYFLFLAANTNDPIDPLVYLVDHETVDEAPYSEQGFTVTDLLTLLATATISAGP